VTDAFERACDRAGMEGFRLHDLRHSFASFHAMQGLPQKGLQALFGHRDSRMTSRYTHLLDTFLRAAVERVSYGAEPKKASEKGTHWALGDSAEKAKSAQVQ
jgi:integrase